MMSCAERQSVREDTLRNLKHTDWDDDVVVEIDQSSAERRQERQEILAYRLLQRVESDGAECMLFLEDDLDFNVHLRHNLEKWAPLQRLGGDDHFFGSIYNPNIRVRSNEPTRAFFIAEPECVYGSQAFVVTRVTVAHIIANWQHIPGMQDIKMSRLAARVSHIYYHVPSLVQHRKVQSLWGGPEHWAANFDRTWKAA
jgi:hypothetical protein